MLLSSEDIKKTKKHLEVMQAFIDGKEIEYRLFTPTNSLQWRIVATPMWDFDNYEYRVKPSEQEYAYPIYKQSREHGTIVKFTGLNSGEYMTKTSSFNIGDYNNNLVEHTDDTFWKDYSPEDVCTEDYAEKQILFNSITIELFEVMVYCDILKEFSIQKILYSQEELEFKQNAYKTGRSFIVDKDTKQIIKIVNI